ncbi:hypothetical protein ACWIDS_11355 [Dietzia maris]
MVVSRVTVVVAVVVVVEGPVIVTVTVPGASVAIAWSSAGVHAAVTTTRVASAAAARDLLGGRNRPVSPVVGAREGEDVSVTGSA